MDWDKARRGRGPGGWGPGAQFTGRLAPYAPAPPRSLAPSATVLRQLEDCGAKVGEGITVTEAGRLHDIVARLSCTRTKISRAAANPHPEQRVPALEALLATLDSNLGAALDHYASLTAPDLLAEPALRAAHANLSDYIRLLLSEATQPPATFMTARWWTAEDDAVFTRMYAERWNCRQIAAALERTEDEVRERYRLLNGLGRMPVKDPSSDTAPGQSADGGQPEPRNSHIARPGS